MDNPNIVGAVCLILLLAALLAGIRENYGIAWTIIAVEAVVLGAYIVLKRKRK